MKRALATSLVMVVTLAGCRAAAPLPRLTPPELQVGAMAQRTDFELGITEQTRSLAGDARTQQPSATVATSDNPAQDAPAETAPAGDTPPQRKSQLRAYSTDELDTGNADKLDDDEDQRRRTALFWSGVVITAIGAAATVGLMATGQVMESRLNDGYDGAMSRGREQRLRYTGKLSNRLAIASGGLSLLGIALLLTGYGLDYSVCGKLAERRKKCRNR